MSILKTGKAKAIRLETLDSICKALQCEPGDLLKFESKICNYTQLTEQFTIGFNGDPKTHGSFSCPVESKT